MTSKEKIQQEIGQTLQCLDSVKRAEANPFLFTRIKARMAKKDSVWERTFSFISKPVIAMAIVLLVMAVNGWALLGSNSNDTSIGDSANVSELANEYNVVASVDNYDYENMPITLSARPVALAIFVIEIEEVLLASIACFGANLSTSSKIFNLSSVFSVAASIIRSASFTPSFILL